MRAYQNLNITGSINLSGSFNAGALSATASNAVSASFASTASSVNTLNQPVIVSGSFTVFTGSAVEFQVTDTGVKIGNAQTDRHQITGSLSISGSIIGSTITGTITNAVSSSYPVAVSGSTIYTPVSSISNFSTISSIFLGRSAGSGASVADNSIFIGNSAGSNATSANSSVFIGANVGQGATNAVNSNFIGTQAAQSATFANNSNFIGYRAGFVAANANNSNFIGGSTGYEATFANNSNFIGGAAGYQAVSASNSNFLGVSAGYGAVSASHSNFLGANAGSGSISATNSNFIGFLAGESAVSASNSNFLGERAGQSATNANGSNFLGYYAGNGAINADGSNFLGFQAGISAINAYSSNFIGQNAGANATNANNSTFIGNGAGLDAVSANNSNFLGTSAGNGATNAIDSTFIGTSAGLFAASASYSTFIGNNAGNGATSASYSTLIGYQVGSTDIGSNNIIIGTNITLDRRRINSINLGGLIFGTGSYANTATSPFSGSANGRIGINQPFPTFSLDVSGSGRYTNGLTITGSVNISGSLLVNGVATGAGGGATVTISGSIPSGSVPSGSLWWNNDDGNLYIQITGPTGSTYVPSSTTIAQSTSASYALTASFALNAGTGGGGASVTISGSAPSGSNPSGSLWWNNNDGNLYIQVTGPTGSTYVPATNTVAGGEYGATFRQGFTGSTWTVNHNLNTTSPLVNVYSGSAVMIPASIVSTNANTTTIAFSGSVQGTAVVSTGIGGPTSSSFALNAVTASYALNSPAGGAPVYAVLTRSTAQAGVAANIDLNWDSISTNASITQPSGSGTAFVRVPAGIYRITAKLGFNNFTSGVNGLLYVRFVDTGNTILPLSTESIFLPADYSGTSTSSNDAIEGILVATAPFSFKVRCTTAAGSATLRNEYAILIIQSL